MKHHAYHTFTPSPREAPLVSKHKDCVSLHCAVYPEGVGFSVHLFPSDAHIAAVRKLLDELEAMRNASATHSYINGGAS